ncbi:uncharacterized protein LOC122002515 [Zingiber officinale]|uniref:Uncharacterized protein n=1 Tax=Zingiber officinale TaxID=94328 RepID=A0A8J5FRQ4_ZINOF|nr:uncharacterized protein LOC122002515 [Zingiber officinale]KAG6493946.1 hypothetical protein ZIOFF_048952 [Zingiber officinale]
MAVQIAGGFLQWSQLSAAPSPSAMRMVLSSPFLTAGPSKLSRAGSVELRRRRRSEEQALRCACSANAEHFEGDAGELARKIEELAFELQRRMGDGGWRCEGGGASSAAPSASFFSPDSEGSSVSPMPDWLSLRPDPPDWSTQMVPASVEMNANSVDLPLSLRIIKRRKRLEKGWFREASDMACCSVKRAFSSMVFMIRELLSYTLQLRGELFHGDLQGVLAQVQREMNSSFVWLFQHIFSRTPTLMVSLMLLLANFTVYSMGHLDAAAMAAPNSLARSVTESVVIEDHRQSHRDRSPIVKLFSSTGRTASVGGSGVGGGGKTRPVAGATGDERSDDGSSVYRTILPDGISSAPASVNAEKVGENKKGETLDEARSWNAILEEASRMQAATRDAALLDRDTLRRLLSPVTVELEPDVDYPEYLRTELMYQEALSEEPENPLLLANFAQFVYLVRRDLDRAEHYFKRAASSKPADADALSRYASFLWLAKKDLEAAEETYLEAISADPSNTFHAANYAHFLWNTGGEDTCFPLNEGGDDQ